MTRFTAMSYSAPFKYRHSICKEYYSDPFTRDAYAGIISVTYINAFRLCQTNRPQVNLLFVERNYSSHPVSRIVRYLGGF